ncbi:protein-glutamate methylesterase/protein-glutamine glutaminase [Fusibacter ferrireducens]|uniref:Protein-glutamate methylesterase/protein-glutamine glutaminase n=1 Tax=Fusibacter ferrireducens TaxID=2785058 RepID=A0ABR9ZTI6_9FIRM|nr:chemotaxis response regulator protein-glutamate methylesterase [Fusibacter ferrireducens]MBF4693790.1 chemotaxis response regulator protein-glutamate methylesterase [Fusibacter ferrireducens]
MSQRKIRVLIVDDSLLFRETLKNKLEKDAGIEVVATAMDPYDARDKILIYEPDVMILDVQMPKMDGIEFLKRLMPQYPLPVVVMSSLDNMVFDALKYGAVEFVNKPSSTSENALDLFINELIIKVKIASIANVSGLKRIIRKSNEESKDHQRQTNRIIAVGASTGGTEALFEILHKLPADVPGIVIVQHMPPVFTKMYAQRLNSACRMIVKEAEDGDEVQDGIALIAPGGLQMRLHRQGRKMTVKLFEGDKRNGHIPSVDVLFESVAQFYGKQAIGIILTGMGQDGAKGLLNMKQNGAKTIGQDEKTCIVYGMPKVAYDIGAVDYQLPITEIHKKILALI